MRHVTLVAVVVLLALGGVSQAAEFSLVTAGSSAAVPGSVGGTMLVYSIDPQPTGTGNIDPFLKYHAGGSTPTQQAYNFNFGLYDQVSGNDAYGSGNWTHLLLASDLATFDIGGTQYFKFIVDIDQQGGSPYISLDQLVFSWSYDATLHPVVDTSGAMPVVPSLGTVFYNMGANVLLLNYGLNSGSGGGDYMFYVPAAAVPLGAYVFLYNGMGFLGGDYSNNDGPDEWWVATGRTVVPEPATLLLLGTGLVGLARLARRRH